jgi:hypothetical protein
MQCRTKSLHGIKYFIQNNGYFFCEVSFVIRIHIVSANSLVTDKSRRDLNELRITGRDRQVPAELVRKHNTASVITNIHFVSQLKSVKPLVRGHRKLPINMTVTKSVIVNYK